MRLWLWCGLLLVAPLQAAEELHGLKDQEAVERFQQLSWELRCPKCQNQNLADSNAAVAADLRSELVRLINAERSDEEIVDFMVSRYGEFVLYRPRLEGRNWLLWLSPLGLLLLGFIIIAWLVRRGRAAAPPELDAGERERLRRLTGGDGT